MGVKVTTKRNWLPRMQKEFDALNGKKVQVGALVHSEHTWLAGIHEYGCNIPVTDKMRAYLHANGLHLKDTTTEIHIPERSFLRTGYDTNRDAVLDKVENLAKDVGGSLNTKNLCKAVGLLLASRIKDYLVDLDKPANHPFTVERKGSANPLVDSGDMAGSITYKVV